MGTLTQIGNALHFIFGGDFPDEPLKLHQAMARAVMIYLVGLAIVRIGKSRLIARMSALDVIIGFLLGSLLSRGITGHASISGSIGSCAAIVATHWLLTRIACNWHWFGDLIKGHAYLIINDGARVEANLQKSHISEHDLQEELRLHALDDVQRVRQAYKERNGDVSVLKKKEPPKTIDIAVQSGVQTVRLQLE